MKWVGLTGGLATGKSTVKKLIEGLDFPVIDADQIAHELSQTGQAGYHGIVSHFGNGVLLQDQALDRKALGKIIFNDPDQRLKLENILHPLIQVEVSRQRKIHEQANKTLCFYDVPLLFEKDLRKNFDRVVMVWAEPAIQKLRLAARNHFTEAEMQSRLNAQMPMSYKIKSSDHCLDNSTDLQGLERQVRVLLSVLLWVP